MFCFVFASFSKSKISLLSGKIVGSPHQRMISHGANTGSSLSNIHPAHDLCLCDFSCLSHLTWCSFLGFKIAIRNQTLWRMIGASSCCWRSPELHFLFFICSLNTCSYDNCYFGYCTTSFRPGNTTSSKYSSYYIDSCSRNEFPYAYALDSIFRIKLLDLELWCLRLFLGQIAGGC